MASRRVLRMTEAGGQYDLIVIGGGVSGFSTVYHLFKGGYEAKIGMLEARDRLGGRLYSLRTPINRECIEVGANWIHGTQNNPIYRMMKSLCQLNRTNIYSKLFCSSSSSDSERSLDEIPFVRDASTGKVIDSFLVKKVAKFYKFLCNENAIADAKMYERMIETATNDESQGVFMRKQIDEWLAESFQEPNEAKIARAIMETFLNYETTNVGCDSMDEASFKYYNTFQELPGIDANVPKGFFALIEILQEKIEKLSKKGSRIFECHLCSPVVKIRWPGEASQGYREEYPITIVCGNGKQYRCRHVVCTIPVGCLQRTVHGLFEPNLPQYKLDSIGRLGFGVVDKIFFEYANTGHLKEAFKDHNDYYIIWNEEEVPRWCRKICALTRYSKHVIMFWISGREAEFVEQMSPGELNQILTDKLKIMFANANFPRADYVLANQWATDPYSCGSYSFIKVGQTPKDIENYSKPIYNHYYGSKVSVLSKF